MEHPAVAEAGVIGKPDPVAGEVVKAFVALRAGVTSRPTRSPRAARLRPRAGSARRSRRARSTFVDAIPKTRSGKIMRRLLRARELGLPEGDLSTLEETAR